MGIEELIEEKNNNFPERVYVLFYNDEFFIRSSLKVIAGGSDKNKVEMYDLEEKQDIKLIAGSLNMPALFSTSKYVVITNFQKIKKNGLEIIEQYLKNPSPTAVLFLYVYGEGKKLRNLKGKSVKTIDLVLKKGEITRWLKERAAWRSFILDSDAVSYLKEFFDENLSMLDNEIEKLSLLGHKKVTKDILLESFYGTKTINAFSLPEAIVKGERAKALSLYSQIREKSDPLMILGAINWKVSTVGTKDRKSFKVYETLINTELNLKQTSLEYPLEMLIAELCSLKN